MTTSTLALRILTPDLSAYFVATISAVRGYTGLKLHWAVEHKDESYECPICGRMFPSIDDYVNTCTSYPDSGLSAYFVATISVVKGYTGLKLHWAVEHKDESYECPICGRMFPSIDDYVNTCTSYPDSGLSAYFVATISVVKGYTGLKLHWAVEHKDESYECPICGRMFPSIDDYVNTCTSYPDSGFVCLLCGYYFKRWNMQFIRPHYLEKHCQADFDAVVSLRDSWPLHFNAIAPESADQQKIFVKPELESVAPHSTDSTYPRNDYFAKFTSRDEAISLGVQRIVFCGSSKISNTSFPCARCLKETRRTHWSETPGEVVKGVFAFQKHWDAEHGGPPYECDKCQQKFGTIPEFVNACFSYPDWGYVCKVCGYCCKNFHTQFREHFMIDHPPAILEKVQTLYNKYGAGLGPPPDLFSDRTALNQVKKSADARSKAKFRAQQLACKTCGETFPRTNIGGYKRHVLRAKCSPADAVEEPAISPETSLKKPKMEIKTEPDNNVLIVNNAYTTDIKPTI